MNLERKIAMGPLNNSGFDWNGNGKSDAFDNYMDVKVSGSDSSDSDGDESETNSSPTSTHKKILQLQRKQRTQRNIYSRQAIVRCN